MIDILANRRSGNNDGAHILSYFRRMMNPCQILDLSVHSPLLILKWCSLIPVGVKFYVLVAGGDGTVAWVLNSINKSAINLPVIFTIYYIILHNFIQIFQNSWNTDDYHDFR